MTPRKRLPPGMRCSSGYDGSAGVSEVIGAVLLIALVVTAVTVVAAVVFSQPLPESVPDVNFMVGTDNRNPPTLYIMHNGGNMLQAGRFSVYVDGNLKPYSIAGGGEEWSLGKNLVVPLSTGETPQRIIIVLNTSGSAVIGSASANLSVSSGGLVTDKLFRTSVSPVVCINKSDPEAVLSAVLENVSVIGAAMNRTPEAIGPVIANVVGASSINYYREGATTIDQYTYFKFNITEPGAVISFDTTTVRSLDIGDTLVIRQSNNNPGTWKIFGLGNQIWEFSAQQVDVNWKKKSSGTWTNSSATTLYHAWIPGYSDMGSTLTLETTQGGYYTALVVNGIKRIEGVSSNTVVIQDVRPVGVGLFVLEYDHNTNSVYFIGNAQSVTW